MFINHNLLYNYYVSLHHYFLVTLNQYVLNGSAQFHYCLHQICLFFPKMSLNLNKESFIDNISIFGHAKIMQVPFYWFLEVSITFFNQ